MKPTARVTEAATRVRGSELAPTSVFDPPDHRYDETGELGRGGMGRVVEAYDRALGRAVAIKQSLATSPTDLARFEREARITAKLQHPGVVPILDVGRASDGSPYYIMRKIEGEPLAARVQAARTIGDRLALLPSLLGAVDAAAYAHAKHIVHRDIKPWNILLGPFGETLLIDWGIARELDNDDPNDGAGSPGVPAAIDRDSLTRAGRAYGTPGFLAPEQARGEPVDARADVYSLGATLYYLLTAKVPFGTTNPTVVIERTAADHSPDFAAISDRVPQELKAIATKALAPNPADRYADGGELAADLRRFLADQLVAAHHYTARERVLKWLRRHRVAVTAGAIAIAAIAVVTTIAIGQVIRDRDAATAARDLATERADDALIDRARSLVASDPTSAVALLRDLPAQSPRWRDAHAIVRAAVRGGVERRIASHGRSVRVLAFSPTGTWLASASDRISLYHVPTNATNEVSQVWARQLVWWGPHTLAYRAGGDNQTRVGTIDVESGVERTLAASAPIEILTFEDRLIVIEAGGRLLAFEHDLTKQPEVLAGGAHHAVARGARLVIMEADQLTVRDRSDRIRMIAHKGSARDELAISEDGSRIAVNSHGRVSEWLVDDGAAPPRSWQLSATALNNIEYIGNALVAWTSDGSGFVSLGEATPHPLWTAQDRKQEAILTHHILPFDGGAILTTDNCDLAIASSVAAAPLPHRAISMTAIAVQRTGKQLAIGSATGDLMLLDLAHAMPRSFPLAPSIKLVGISGTNTLLLDPVADPLVPASPTPSSGVLAVTGLTLFDPESGKSVSLGTTSRFLLVGDELIVETSPGEDRFRVWNGHGQQLFVLDDALWFTFHGTTVYWIDRDRKVWSRTAPTGQPTLITSLPADYRLRPADRSSGPLVGRLSTFDGSRDLVLTTWFGDTSHAYQVTSQGLVEIPLPNRGVASIIGKHGGAWWIHDHRDLKYGELWRENTRVNLSHPADKVHISRDHVWALGDDVLSEIDPAGHVVTELAVPTGPLAAYTPTSMLTTVANGLIEVVPRANLRSTLRLLGAAVSVAVSSDGKRIAVVTRTRDNLQSLQYWVDTVPSDPAALRAYLDRLTNARIVAGRNAIRWD